jgi:hypothetical protein
MRAVSFAAGIAALGLAGAALAIGPPQPPQPTGSTSTSITVQATPAGGLRGYVTVGPTSPTCSPGKACFRPAHVTLRFWRNGHLVLAVPTRATGYYRAQLPAGVYAVRIPRTRGLIKPTAIRVWVDRWRRVDFVVSVGIY